MNITPWEELEANLDLAEHWYETDIKSAKEPATQSQLRYSLVFKLSSNWQIFLKGVGEHNGLSKSAIKKIGNGSALGIDAAYGGSRKSPLAGIEADYEFFSSFNELRNAIAHGDKPPMPSLTQLEQWMRGFRGVGKAYGERSARS